MKPVTRLLAGVALALVSLVPPAPRAEAKPPSFTAADVGLFDVVQGSNGVALDLVAGDHHYAIFVPESSSAPALLGIRAERQAAAYSNNPYGIPDNHLAQEIDRNDRYYNRPDQSAPAVMRGLLHQDVARTWTLDRAQRVDLAKMIRIYVRQNAPGKGPLFRAVYPASAAKYRDVANRLSR